MAPVVPDSKTIREFPDQAAFAAWLESNHDGAPELWLTIHKKGSGLPTVTHAEALDVALCWGWIDGQRKALDSKSFLQRFTPRGKRSTWSQKNRDNVERLIGAGRMTAFGLAEIDAAKADGRWAAAYAGGATMEPPEDLLSAIAAEPEAHRMYRTLNAQNRYTLSRRTHGMKTEAGRKKKIAGFVDMLKRGETIYPNGKSK